MATIFTIGYEQSSPDLLVDALVGAGVTMLADIRAVPASRRRGFSKRALSARVEDAGLRYRHLVALGNPKAGRDAGRAGRMDEFRRIYAQQLDSDAAKVALGDLARLSAAETLCLLCYERDAEHCHRSIVAAALADACTLTVHHLSPETGPATASSMAHEGEPRAPGTADVR